MLLDRAGGGRGDGGTVASCLVNALTTAIGFEKCELKNRMFSSPPDAREENLDKSCGIIRH